MSTKKYSKDINFLKAYRENKKSNRFNKTVFLVVFSLLFFIFSCSLLYAFLSIKEAKLKTEMDSINSYIGNPDNVSAYTQALQNETTMLKGSKAQKDELSAAQEAIDAYPGLTEEEFKTFLACSGTEITVNDMIFNSVKADFSYDVNAVSVSAISAYIERLRSTGLFSDIIYNGYEYINSTNYKFNLSCVIKK